MLVMCANSSLIVEKDSTASLHFKSKVLQFFSNHPLLGLLGALGSIASIIGLPYTIFTPKRVLTFAVNSPRTPIVQLARTSNISVAFNGRLVNQDVTAAQVAIWNAGKEPIRSDDVLAPIVLKTGSNAPILEISFALTNNDVTRFWIDATNMANGELRFSWRILEKNDGAVVQVIYAGKPNTPITVEGAVVGQRRPLQASRETPLQKVVFVLQVANILTGGCIVGLVVYWTLHWEIPTLLRPSYQIAISALVTLLVVVTFLYLVRDKLVHPTLSPFGF
jgi:hypothetical protein